MNRDPARRILEQSVDEAEVEGELGTGVVREDVDARLPPKQKGDRHGAVVDEEIVVVPVIVRRADGVAEVDAVAPEARIEQLGDALVPRAA